MSTDASRKVHTPFGQDVYPFWVEIGLQGAQVAGQVADVEAHCFRRQNLLRLWDVLPLLTCQVIQARNTRCPIPPPHPPKKERSSVKRQASNLALGKTTTSNKRQAKSSKARQNSPARPTHKNKTTPATGFVRASFTTPVYIPLLALSKYGDGATVDVPSGGYAEMNGHCGPWRNQHGPSDV